MSNSLAAEDAVAEFHLAVVRALLQLLNDRGITDIAKLRAVRGQKLLKESIWKYNERAGKYVSEYVSEGVRRLEEKLGRHVSCANEAWQALEDSAFELEHVDELDGVVQKLLRAGPNGSDVIVKAVKTCVVLRSEHKLLAKGKRGGDPWNRYRNADKGRRCIGVWSRTQDEWIVEPNDSAGVRTT